MKNYAPENAAFKLPFQFNPIKLKQDLDICFNYDFLQNYIPANYNGKNYILPLRSIDGKLNAPAALPNQQHRYKDTIVMEKCYYFRESINLFLCDKEAIRLMNLPPGANINTHVDDFCGYEDGLFRVHIPITTNDEVYFTLNDKRIVMESGQVWYTNVNLPHSVANKGNTNRIHLVMDCVRNEWSDELFKTLGYNFDLEYDVQETLSTETIQLMIKELKLQNTPASKQLIEQLKEQL